VPRVLFVIAPERFRDEELEVPRRALETAGCRVEVASTKTGTARGMLGASVKVERSLADAGEDWDAVVFVGGSGSPDHLWDSEPAHRLAQREHAAGRPVAAICLSGAVLARAGLLSGKRATVFPAPRAIAELKRGGAEYVPQPVIVDGTVVTASGPEAAEAFAAAILKQLGR
jgi:protease I